MKYNDCFMGIDPGKTGSAAIYFPKTEGNDPQFLFLDWPKENNPMIVRDQISDWINGDAYTIQFAILEKVASMPGQGVKSVFSFGINYGMWQAILASLCISYQMMPPQQWQKGLITGSDGADPKKRGRNFVTRMWPNQLREFMGPKGGWKDGRADAAIMAYKAYLLREEK